MNKHRQSEKTISTATSSESTDTKSKPASLSASAGSSRASSHATTAETKLASPRSSSGSAAEPPETKSDQDAIALLKADHRAVDELFSEFESARDAQEKQRIATKICGELIIHMMIEEELFYPACRENEVVDEALMDEAQVEQDGAKIMIAEILNQKPDAPFYAAKVKVLAEYITHHVGEEEKPDGIFAKASEAGVDMMALGLLLQKRKQELTGKNAAEALRTPALRSMDTFNTTHRYEETRSMSYNSNNTRDRDEQGRFKGDDEEQHGRNGGSHASSPNRSNEQDDRRYANGDHRSERYAREDDNTGRYNASGQRGSENGGQYGRQSTQNNDDRYGSSSRNNGGQGMSGRPSNDRERDEHGRFKSEDENQYSRNGGSRSASMDRDNQQSDRQYASRGGRSEAYGRDEHNVTNYGSGSRGQESGYGRGEHENQRGGRNGSDHDGQYGRQSQQDGGRYGASSQRGPEQGMSERSQSESGRGMDHNNNGSDRERDEQGRYMRGDDHQSGRNDGSRSPSRASAGQDDQDHRGWHGDTKRHSEAARRGWQNR